MINSPELLIRRSVKFMILGLTVFLLSCGEKKEALTEDILGNELATGPTDFTRHYQHSKINWQNWDEGLFKEAKKQQRPVMALISSGRYTESFEVLDSLEESKELHTKLNEDFVTCFVDTQAYPEMATLAYNLSANTGNYSFPFVIWFSPDGDPLSWQPLIGRSLQSSVTSLLSMANSVKDTWIRDPEYSRVHSKKTNDKLLARHKPLVKEEPEEGTSREESYRRIIRGLLAFYDPVDESLDRVGSLIPYKFLEALDSYHYYPGKDPQLDLRAQEVLKAVIPAYLNTPLKDPVDRGFFYAKLGKGWDSPNFAKILDTQSSLIQLLSSPSMASFFPQAEEYTQDAITYIDENLTNQDKTIASYQVVEGIKNSQSYHLWSEEELKSLLTKSEFKIVSYMSKLKERGNISEVSDPTKKYYRKNTLAELSLRSKAATELGLNPASLAQDLDSAWVKIGLAREKRGLELNYTVFKETTPIVKQQAQAAKAYLLAYQGSGNDEYLKKAHALLSLIKNKFWTPGSGLLRIVAQDSAATSISARGLDYTIVIRAYLLAHQITLSPDHLAFAQILSKEAHEKLADENGFLQEVRKDELWCRGEIYSFLMLFEDSTLGTLPLLSAQIGELAQDANIIKQGQESYRIVERGAEKLGIVHTDFLEIYPRSLREIIVLTGDPTDPQTQALQKVLHRPQFKGYHFFHYSKNSTATVTLELKDVEQPAIHLFKAGEILGVAKSVEELELLLESN